MDFITKNNSNLRKTMKQSLSEVLGRAKNRKVPAWVPTWCDPRPEFAPFIYEQITVCAYAYIRYLGQVRD